MGLFHLIAIAAALVVFVTLIPQVSMMYVRYGTRCKWLQKCPA